MTTATQLIGTIALSLLCWLRARHAPGRSGPWIGAMLGLGLAVELAAELLRRYHIPNTPIYNVYVCVEFILFMRVATIAAPSAPLWSSISLICGLCVMGASAWYHRGEVYLLTEGVLVMSVLGMLWSMRVLWHLSLRDDRPVWRQPLFWFFTGTMIYFGCIVPLVGTMRFFSMSGDPSHVVLYEIFRYSALARYLLAAISCHLAASSHGWHDGQR